MIKKRKIFFKKVCQIQKKDYFCTRINREVHTDIDYDNESYQLIKKGKKFLKKSLSESNKGFTFATRK